MPTKKLIVSTYPQYILVAMGALLLFTFVHHVGVVLTFFMAGVLAYTSAFAIVGVISLVKRNLGETLVLEPRGKATLSEIPAGSEGPVSAPGEARSTVLVRGTGGDRPAVGDRH